jgi:hypothetical protein
MMARAPLDEDAGNAAQTQIQREPQADRPAADDSHLITFAHFRPGPCYSFAADFIARFAGNVQSAGNVGFAPLPVL